MDKVILYFGYVMFFIILLYIAFYLLSYLFICLGESLKKAKHKNDINVDSNSNDDKIDNDIKLSKIRIMVVNAYEGLYRVLVFTTGRIPCNWLRKFIYKYVFKMNIDKNVVIHKGVEIRGGYKISIGKGTIIGDDCLLDGRGGLVIGENVNFSSRACIYTMQHDYQAHDFKGISGRVIIGDRAWISCNSTVLPGVTIANNCVVAAGAVVSKTLEKSGLYGGIPAKFLKDRTDKLDYEFKGYSCWFL